LEEEEDFFGIPPFLIDALSLSFSPVSGASVLHGFGPPPVPPEEENEEEEEDTEEVRTVGL
jgi:hypothetical protein